MVKKVILNLPVLGDELILTGKLQLKKLQRQFCVVFLFCFVLFFFNLPRSQQVAP